MLSTPFLGLLWKSSAETLKPEIVPQGLAGTLASRNLQSDVGKAECHV